MATGDAIRRARPIGVEMDMIPRTKSRATGTPYEALQESVDIQTSSSPSLYPFPGAFIASSLDGCRGLEIGHMVTGTRRVARHTSLYRQHDKMGMLYLVRFGQFKLITGKLYDERVAGFHMAGDLLGLDAIATGEQNFRVTALENSEVCEILSRGLKKQSVLNRQFGGNFYAS